MLYQTYSARGRNPAVDPKTMFKILIYAYFQNIYSSRKIETACRRDINFMWLKTPDHSVRHDYVIDPHIYGKRNPDIIDVPHKFCLHTGIFLFQCNVFQIIG